jgi:hypothetical protein
VRRPKHDAFLARVFAIRLTPTSDRPNRSPSLSRPVAVSKQAVSTTIARTNRQRLSQQEGRPGSPRCVCDYVGVAIRGLSSSQLSRLVATSIGSNSQ